MFLPGDGTLVCIVLCASELPCFVPVHTAPVCLQQENGTPQASTPGDEQLKYILNSQSV